MKLYDYYRSSAAYRVRIALALKGLPAERAFIHLRRGMQVSDEYLALNPQGLVPMLENDAGEVLTQSLAIIEWLEETHPMPALLPQQPIARARARSFALAIACDIHPLNNLRVLHYLTGPLSVSEAQKNAWYCHWIEVGLVALERQLAADAKTGRFCFGDTPMLADICLVPQLANARRFGVALNAYPTLLRIDEACKELPAFAAAAPENQRDFEP